MKPTQISKPIQSDKLCQNSTKTKKNDKLIKSKKRVADHGEVFTPSNIVGDMLDLIKSECERIDSRFLEPACGNGNFLMLSYNTFKRLA